MSKRFSKLKKKFILKAILMTKEILIKNKII